MSLLQLNRMKLQNKLTHIVVLFRSNLVRSIVTVGHILREISRLCYFFLKEEGGEINGNVFSTTHQPSPIPYGGLEIPLVLRFQSPKYVMQSEVCNKHYTAIAIPAQILILAMKNPRKKSVFQLKKET